MADRTSIEWTDATWNPLRARHRTTGKVGWHCEHASPGCKNCYAEPINAVRFGTGLPFKPGHRGDVDIVLDEKTLTEPLRWRRPRRIFPGSMTDLFGDWVTDAMLDRIFAVMALCPQHTLQVLTKRSARMRDYVGTRAGSYILDLSRAISDAKLEQWADDPSRKATPRWPLPNVWLGVSAEDQARADERVPDLLATPAAVRFVSAEPLLGPLDLSWALSHPIVIAAGFLERGQFSPGLEKLRRLDWIIVGGESGPNARPMHPAWARAIRDQCAATGTAFHFKQWGAWGPTHPDWPRAEPTVMADDGTLYRPADIAYPDGARYGEAVRANHDKAHLTSIYRVGKKAAGRLLDGVEHNGMPAGTADQGPEIRP